jgi:hypothetical protein
MAGLISGLLNVPIQRQSDSHFKETAYNNQLVRWIRDIHALFYVTQKRMTPVLIFSKYDVL